MDEIAVEEEREVDEETGEVLATTATVSINGGPSMPLDSPEAQSAMEDVIRSAMGIDGPAYEPDPQAPLEDIAWEKIETPAQINALSIVRKTNGSVVTVKMEVPRSQLHALGNLNDAAGFQMRWRNPHTDNPIDRLVGESVDLAGGSWTKGGDPSAPKRVSITVHVSADQWKRMGGWLGSLIADDSPGQQTSIGLLTLEPNQQTLNLRERA